MRNNDGRIMCANDWPITRYDRCIVFVCPGEKENWKNIWQFFFFFFLKDGRVIFFNQYSKSKEY